MSEHSGPVVKCDVHVHSLRSGHAFSTVDELAAAAFDANLDLIAITDHGPSMEGAPHSGYFEMVGRLPAEIRGVRVFMGVEANIVSANGTLDLPDPILRRQQWVLAGLHERTGFAPGSCQENTRAITLAMEGGLVDAISHPYRPSFVVDVSELARAAAETGVCLEVNTSLIQWALTSPSESQKAQVLRETRRMIDEAIRRGASCVVCSDAHHSSELRAFPTSSRAVIEALDIPLDIIANRHLSTLMQCLSK